MLAVSILAKSRDVGQTGLGKGHIWDKTLTSVTIDPEVSLLYHSGGMAWREPDLHNS